MHIYTNKTNWKRLDEFDNLIRYRSPKFIRIEVHLCLKDVVNWCGPTRDVHQSWELLPGTRSSTLELLGIQSKITFFGSWGILHTSMPAPDCNFVYFKKNLIAPI